MEIHPRLSIKHLFPAGRHYSLKCSLDCSTPKDIFPCTMLFIRLPCSYSIDLDSLGLLQHTAKPNLTGSSSDTEMAAVCMARSVALSVAWKGVLGESIGVLLYSKATAGRSNEDALPFIAWLAGPGPLLPPCLFGDSDRRR